MDGGGVMGEQIIGTDVALTVESLRRRLAELPGDMPVRDHIKRQGLAVTVLKTDRGEVLEVS